MKSVFVIFFLLFTFNLYSQDKSAVLKINIIRGESTVTPAVDPSALETILTAGLTSKGYSVYTKNSLPDLSKVNIQNLYLADAFFYQFPGEFPSVTITIRKNNQTLLLLHDNKKMFGDRKAALESIAKDLVEEIPANLSETKFLLPNLENIVPSTTISLISATSGAITSGYASKYIIELENKGKEALNFMVEDAFKAYFSLCLDFNGYRKLLKEEPIIADIEVNKFGITEIKNIKLPSMVKDKYRQNIEQAIQALPLWQVVNGQSYNGSLKIGIKN